MFESLTLSNIRHTHRAVLRNPSSTRPAVWIVEENGLRAVVKDFGVNRFLFRNTVGRFLVWRESKALRRLHGIRGIPRLYRVIDGQALVMEEIRGRDLEEVQEEKGLPESFFFAMKKLVDQFHERGVAHCDLKRAPNTLIGPEGAPYIIDWGASISKTEFPFFPLNRIYQRFLLDDCMAIMKLRLKHSPETVTREELRRYTHRGRTEVHIRRIRDRLRTWLQKMA